MRILSLFIAVLLALSAFSSDKHETVLRFSNDFDSDGRDDFYEFAGIRKGCDAGDEDCITEYRGKLFFVDADGHRTLIDNNFYATGLSVINLKNGSYLCCEMDGGAGTGLVAYHGTEKYDIGEIDADGKKMPSADGINFKLYVRDYGVCPDGTGRFYCDSWGFTSPDGSLHEYGGILLSSDMLEKFRGGKEMLERIEKMFAPTADDTVFIREIWYRGNGIIDINVDVHNFATDSISYYHVSLTSDGSTVTGMLPEDPDFGRSGHASSAYFPSRAVYPAVPEFLRR